MTAGDIFQVNDNIDAELPDTSSVAGPGADVSPEAMKQSAMDAANFLKALSHEYRLLLLCLLSEREMSVSELEQALDLRQANVSQQLARLRSDKLVSTRRDGKVIYYSIADERVRRTIGLMYELFCDPEK